MSAIPSLFDTVDVASVTATAARWHAPGALLVAGLVEGVLSRGRHRVVVGSERMRPTVTVALPGGWTDETPGRALGVACGVAAALGSGEDGRRVWCLLDAEACDDGGTWEAARAAIASGVGRLVTCVVSPPSEAGQLAALWRAAGWVVVEAADGSPWEVLGALDQALATRGQPVALMVVSRAASA